MLNRPFFMRLNGVYGLARWPITYFRLSWHLECFGVIGLRLLSALHATTFDAGG